MSITNIDIDDKAASSVEHNDEEELVNNQVSTMISHSLDANVRNIDSNNNVVVTIPPSQSNNVIHSSDKDPEITIATHSHQTCKTMKMKLMT